MTVLAEIAGQGVQSTTRDELKLVLPGNKTLESARKYFQKVLLSLEVRFVESLKFYDCYLFLFFQGGKQILHFKYWHSSLSASRRCRNSKN